MNDRFPPLTAKNMNTDGAIALAEAILRGMAEEYKQVYKKYLLDKQSKRKYQDWKSQERMLLRHNLVWTVTGDAYAVISALNASVEREVNREKNNSNLGGLNDRPT